MVTGTPARARSSPSIMPAGPPPTTQHRVCRVVVTWESHQTPLTRVGATPLMRVGATSLTLVSATSRTLVGADPLTFVSADLLTPVSATPLTHVGASRLTLVGADARRCEPHVGWFARVGRSYNDVRWRSVNQPRPHDHFQRPGTH